MNIARHLARLFLLLLAPAISAHAGILQRGKVQLICHRTANRDMPENTLESLALAARMGCNIVEIDIRKTADGQLVLNHDDFLERLTGGMGTVELTSYDELQLLDTGAWMGERFTGMRIPRFEEAVQIAREQGIGLYLDIKTKGIAPLLLEILEREGMLERVVFGGEWEDVRALYPNANHDAVAYINPGCNTTQVTALQRQGKFVVANFSANAYEMNLEAMRAAATAGVDALNVDYPRLGADAVGRPVEAKLAELTRTASAGSMPARLAAIREAIPLHWFSHSGSLRSPAARSRRPNLACGSISPGQCSPGDSHTGLYRSRLRARENRAAKCSVGHRHYGRTRYRIPSVVVA